MKLSADTVRKGERLHAEGRVLALVEYLGHGYAIVAGDNDVYLVHLFLEGDQPVTGEHRCTCPAHVTCSHIVAALLRWSARATASDSEV